MSERRELTEQDIAHCHNLVDKLVALYKETDPSHGKQSEKYKHEKALKALNIIGTLAAGLTEWAECQILGGYYQLAKSNNKYIDRETTDSHKNETMWYSDDAPEWSVNDDLRYHRLAIATILQNTYSEYGKREWRFSLKDSLLKLNDGQTPTLLATINTQQHGNAFDLEALQWASVKHIYKILGETGDKKMAIRAKMAELCGIKYESMRTWEKDCIQNRDQERIILNSIKEGGAYIRFAKANNPLITNNEIMLEAIRSNRAASEIYDEKLSRMSHGIISCIKLDEDFPLETLAERLIKAGLRTGINKNGVK